MSPFKLGKKKPHFIQNAFLKTFRELSVCCIDTHQKHEENLCGIIGTTLRHRHSPFYFTFKSDKIKIVLFQTFPSPKGQKKEICFKQLKLLISVKINLSLKG